MRSIHTIRQVRAVYKRPCSDIQGSVDVGVGSVVTGATPKLGLTGTILFRAVSALVASSAGIARIDSHENHTSLPGLVFQKLPKLRKGPGMQNCPLFTPGLDPFANTTQFLNGNPATGAFSFNNDLLGDIMISPDGKTAFFARQNLESALCCARLFLLQLCAQAAVAIAHRFNLRTRVAVSIRIAGDISHAHIHTQKIGGLDRSSVRQIDGAVKVKPPLAVDQIGLPFDSIESRLLIFPIDQRDDHAPLGKRPEAHSIQTFEAKDALIVGDRPEAFEYRADLPVASETLNCLANSPNRHLRGKIEAGANFRIGQFVNRWLAEYLRFKSAPGGKCRRFVKAFHCFQQSLLLIRVWQQLQLERKFHFLGAYHSLLAFLLLLAAAAAGAQQVNPHTQIRWPGNCNSPGMTYNFTLNTCINMNAIDPAAQVTWPPSCSTGVYVPSTNTCVAPGTAANPAGPTGSLQFNAGGLFGGTSNATLDAAGNLGAAKYGNIATPLSADAACAAGQYWIAPIAGTRNKWRQCSNGQLTDMGSLPGTSSTEVNSTVPYQQPATGISTMNGVLCIGDSTGGQECQWLMDASASIAITQGAPSGSIANPGDTAADSTFRLFSKYTPGPLNNPVVTMKIGTNDGRYRGYVGDGIGGTGTKLGYLRFADSNATWATLTPQEKHPATIYPYAVPKVFMSGTTVTLSVDNLTIANESLAVNMPILLNGFTTNTGLNGKVWHIASRTDQSLQARATTITLLEACSTGCATNAAETGTITDGWWPNNSGFSLDTSLGTGKLKNSGSAVMAATTAGATLSTPPASSVDSMWIGPGGVMFLWYYAYNGGTGTFQVTVNGGAPLTDYFTGSSTISNNSAPNLAQNLTTTTTPLVALAAFTGLTPNSYAQVQVTTVAANATTGRIGIIAAGSPIFNSTSAGAGGSPTMIWSGVHWFCLSSVCGGGSGDQATFYNDAALSEAVRIGTPIDKGGWGLSVRPADLRAESNSSWDFVNPALVGSQDPVHPLQIPGHLGGFRSLARAMGLSVTGGNSGTFGYQAIAVQDYTGITCSNTILAFTSPVTSETLPVCPTGKVMVVQSGYNANGVNTPITVKGADGTAVVTLNNGDVALLVTGNPVGGWGVLGVFPGTKNVLGYANGAITIDQRFQFITIASGNLSFSTYATFPPLPGTPLYIRNTSATNTVTLSGVSGGDLPSQLAPGQSIIAYTSGANAWWRMGGIYQSGTVTLASGAATVNTTGVLSTSNIILTHQNCVSCGVAYVGTITAGTSFVINSSNAADGSKIFWELR